MSLSGFFDQLPFQPDTFQVEAAESIAAGRSVVVTAPTGAGKTLVAEAAVHLALQASRRAFYTTPIKALSNQKFADLVDEHGSGRVGLLTGDNVINGDASVVVMTTEVLRNMIYEDSPGLEDVQIVILDEAHYLQDRYRGGVWEEIIIHAPRHQQMVSLSATIANAEEFAGWVRERRGPTDLIVEESRPVPLDSQYLIHDRNHPDEPKLFPMFVTRDGRRRPNPRVERMLSLEKGRRRRYGTPRRAEVMARLDSESMLPAIYFIFSRAGCDAAALRMLDSGIRLTAPDERQAVRALAEERTSHLSDADLDALGYGRWIATLEAGVAAHHAGMVPAFKETVEALFAVGLVRVVFATETLALGINMPARSVVLESLSKFTGESHELLQPGDYTQLTGRAGRRGIDNRGHGVVLHSGYVKFERVTEIASIGSHPLKSSFRPNYNMASNLVAKYEETEARELLEASFAQYQRRSERRASKSTLTQLEERLATEEARAACERGDIFAYLRDVEASAPKKAKSEVAALRSGDVIDVPAGRHAGRYLVLRRLHRTDASVRLLVLGTSGRTHPLGARDIVPDTIRAGSIEMPVPFKPKDRRFRNEALKRMRRVPATERVHRRRVPAPLPDHPVASCPDLDTHVKWANRAGETRRRVDQILAGRIQGRGLIDEFNSILTLLGDWGYVDGWHLTSKGKQLRSIYNELDLLLAECMNRGVFKDLEPEELSGLAACFVYEPRATNRQQTTLPTDLMEDRYQQVLDVATELTAAERSHRLPVSRDPDSGFGASAYAWVSGADLEGLPATDIAHGDFVRVSRQLGDLLRQIRDADSELAPSARLALGSLDRGVVAAGGQSE